MQYNVTVNGIYVYSMLLNDTKYPVFAFIEELYMVTYTLTMRGKLYLTLVL